MRLDEILELPANAPNLLFRFEPFAKNQREQFLREVLGLANANVEGDRFLVFGIHLDVAEKKIVGLTDGDIRTLEEDSRDIISYIEPELTIARIKNEIDGVEVAALRLKQCDNAPYMLKDDFSRSLRSGECWIRENGILRLACRKDLDRMYGRSFGGNQADGKQEKIVIENGAVKIGFDGNFDTDLLEVQIPAANGKSVDSPLTAVELKLAVANTAPCALENAVLELQLPRDRGLSVGQKKSADAQARSQTKIDKEDAKVRVRSKLGNLEPGQVVPAFESPLMLGIGATMRGRKVGIQYALVARNLEKPVKGRLKIKFAG
jgi:hypothetical protein